MEIFSRDDVSEYDGLTEGMPGVKLCKACGKPFRPKNYRQKMCNRTHYGKCTICGKEYDLNLANGISQQPVTCSKECRAKLHSQITKSPEVVAKYKATNMKKYGVENGAKSEVARKKISKALTKTNKPDIELTCVVCGKKFTLPGGSYPRKCCSNECSQKLRSQQISIANKGKTKHQTAESLEHQRQATRETWMKNHGYEYANQNPEIKEKIKQGVHKTSQERFGVDWSIQSDEVKEKIHNTLQEKYRVDHNTDLEEVRRSISEKNREHYKDPEYKKKVEQAQKDKFGGLWASQTPEFQDQVKQTNQEKYGVDFYSQTDECKQRVNETKTEHYGPDWGKQILDKAMSTYKDQTGYAHPSENPEIVHQRHVTIYNKINSPDFDQSKLSDYGVSPLNQKFKDILERQGIKCEYEYPVENRAFDLKLVDRNIVLELDPSFSHCFEGTQWANHDKNFQFSKTELAERHDLRCIHVFDWDNWNKILMLIRPQRTIGARKCKVKEVDQRTADIFTNRYHIQGKCNGQKLNFGLYHNGSLVEVMTFGTPRYARKYKWELLRLCTQTDVTIAGGASKLFNHALKTHPELDNIISYCDRAKFNGTVYKKLGFTLVRTSEPQEIWSYNNKYVTANMLRARGYDQIFNEHYGKGTDNNELMLKRGWLPVYDCGQYVFEYKRDNT